MLVGWSGSPPTPRADSTTSRRENLSSSAGHPIDVLTVSGNGLENFDLWSAERSRSVHPKSAQWTTTMTVTTRVATTKNLPVPSEKQEFAERMVSGPSSFIVPFIGWVTPGVIVIRSSSFQSMSTPSAIWMVQKSSPSVSHIVVIRTSTSILRMTFICRVASQRT